MQACKSSRYAGASIDVLPSLPAQDFHHCGLEPGDDIVNYDSRVEVQTCEADNLAESSPLKPNTSKKSSRRYSIHLLLLVSDHRMASVWMQPCGSRFAASNISNILGRLSATLYVTQAIGRGPADPAPGVLRECGVASAKWACKGYKFQCFHGVSVSTILPGPALRALVACTLALLLLVFILRATSVSRATEKLRTAMSRAERVYYRSAEAGLLETCSADIHRDFAELQSKASELREQGLRASLSTRDAICAFCRGLSLDILRCVGNARTLKIRIEIVREEGLRITEKDRAYFLSKAGNITSASFERRQA
ncbi:hypothetical protein GGX14DRAFT_563298 [Mycena pura]|uniref:Uncharacterized protein n=1 Tax=Mycena pura TaxID=153505 RepID=A0AAD6YD18_9AGAR|nr:hypothetical protein GGX14DRAFT_563298 [Mycena pura]